MKDFLQAVVDNQFFIIVIAAMLVAGYKWIDYVTKNRQEFIDTTRKEFENTLSGLHSAKESEKIAHAILLRRFLNSSEISRSAKFNYKEETVNVIASLLRIERYGEFQKTLADSLSWTDDLQGVDLQYANMQNVYLKPQNRNTKSIINLGRADLYMADLSYASFNRINACGTIFNSANLFRTTFRNCELTGTDFRNADLLYCRFVDSKLEGARFAGASNIPSAVMPKLNEKGVYEENRTEGAYKPVKTDKTVFISCLGVLSVKQSDFLNSLTSRLTRQNISVKRYTREEYRKSGQIGVIRNEMSKCDGVIILGFKHIIVNSGIKRPASNDKKVIKDEWISTPWNNIEAGMASALGLPLLIIKDNDINDGIFEEPINDKFITRINILAPELEFDKSLNGWLQML